MSFLLLAIALGGTPAELALERGRVAIGRGEPMVAVEAALEVGPTDPQARELLIEGFAAAGEGARGLVELAAVPGAPAPWDADRRKLAHLIDSGLLDEAIAASKQLAAAYPEHPELHAPLWEAHERPASLRKHRDKLVDQAVRGLARGDAVYAYRVRALLHAAGRSADPAVDALVRLGEPECSRAAPLGRVERVLAAEVLARSGALPEGPLEQVLEIADLAGERAMAEHQVERALAAWDASVALAPTVEGIEGKSRALAALSRFDDALATVDSGMALAVDPWPEDAAATALAARADALARLLEARAIALEGTNRPLDAFREQAVADLLVRATEDSKLERRVRKSGFAGHQELAKAYSDPGPETALSRAEGALASDPAAALTHAEAALVLFPWLGGTDWHPDAARAEAVRARALTALDRPVEARVAWAKALLLDPDAPADWWASAAALHRSAGHREIAFAWYGTALLRDPELDPAPLAADHRGPAEPRAAAAAVAIPAPVHEEAQVGVRVIRGEVYRTDSVPVAGNKSAATAPVKPGSAMPSWSLQTDGGTIDASTLATRTSVLVFWVADCPPCLQAIQEVGIVARDLRRSGRDVAVVAVSVDPEPRAFDELRQLHKVRVSLAHSPELGQKLGVAQVPSVWIVDPSGRVRYQDVGWRGREAFERALRDAMGDPRP